MSLQVYFNDEPLPEGIEIIRDVDAHFIDVEHPIPECFLKVLKDVEQATPSVTLSSRFVDRFGGELYWDCMSTGSKAAYLIATSGKCVDTRECGENAICSIFEHYSSGTMLMYFPFYDIPDVPMDLVVHGIRFTRGAVLDYYLKEGCR